MTLVGARHWDEIMRDQYHQLHMDAKDLAPQSEWEEGFIDQFGKFYNRKDALIIAKNSGQRLDMDRNGCDNELHSEGIY